MVAGCAGFAAGKKQQAAIWVEEMVQLCPWVSSAAAASVVRRHRRRVWRARVAARRWCCSLRPCGWTLAGGGGLVLVSTVVLGLTFYYQR